MIRWIVAVITVLAAAAAGATEYTSVAAGDWSSIATWDGDGGPPGDGDTVVIGHDVTVDINTTVGDSPDWPEQGGVPVPTGYGLDAGGGIITVAPGKTLTAKCDIRCGSLTLGAGAAIVLDGTAAGNERYGITGDGTLNIAGTSEARCGISSASADAPGRLVWDTTVGSIAVSYCDFAALGKTAPGGGPGPGIDASPGVRLAADDTGGITVGNCSFASSITRVEVEVLGAGLLDFSGNTSACLTHLGSCGGGQVDGNACLENVRITPSMSLDIAGNYFGAGLRTVPRVGEMQVYAGVTIADCLIRTRVPDSSRVSCDVEDCYLISTANERQTVTLDGTVTAGTFTLTFGAETTAAISISANAATMQAALEALTAIGPGDVLVSQYGKTWQIEFTGALAETDVALLVADSTGLTGGAAIVAETALSPLHLVVTAQRSLQRVSGCVFERTDHYAGTASVIGRCIEIDVDGQTVDVFSNLVLPGSAVQMGLVLVPSTYDRNIYLSYNTVAVENAAMIWWGLYGGPEAASVRQCKSNLVRATTGGYKGRRVGDQADLDPISVSSCDYNAGWGLTAGSAGRGYDQGGSADPVWVGGDAATLGVDAHGTGLDGDPAFADATRSLATWGAVEHSTDGSVAAALAILQADPAEIADLVAWVREGWAATATDLIDAGHDGRTLGIQPVGADPPDWNRSHVPLGSAGTGVLGMIPVVLAIGLILKGRRR